MKNLMKLFTVLVVVMFSTSTFAEELGLKVANMNLYAPTAKGKSSSGGGKAFEGKGSKQISIGVGLSSYIGAFGKGGFYSYTGSRGGYYWGRGAFWYSGTLSVQAEFGVHDYVGVGLVTGIGGRAVGGGGVLYVPVGILANFHFFQLVADKKGLGIGDALDLYVGLNFGTGLGASLPKGSGNNVSGIIFAGPQFGVKYFFNPKIGVYGEFGYGKSVFEAGVSIKL
ncbi:MAG TPA: hypothetical protein PKK18_00845 [Chitinophagales bacterium]|nr:hypothetical protein [Chitinophagales bacterium]HMX60869.1 hypothetical protein [Chitinophagales bacterium]HMY22509.1 hypothetical protein [Chitinophagales bacterium]HMZ34507.1 hypothetical protein [Chitinophagales bacterium]HNA40209.1 hypothetical protein [Chitinophagales bacterium]